MKTYSVILASYEFNVRYYKCTHVTHSPDGVEFINQDGKKITSNLKYIITEEDGK